MNFGLVCGSLIAGWYLGDLRQNEPLAVMSALHRTFLTVGGLTILSSLSFWTLRPMDGDKVSQGREPQAPQDATSRDARGTLRPQHLSAAFAAHQPRKRRQIMKHSTVLIAMTLAADATPDRLLASLAM